MYHQSGQKTQGSEHNDTKIMYVTHSGMSCSTGKKRRRKQIVYDPWIYSIVGLEHEIHPVSIMYKYEIVSNVWRAILYAYFIC